jgi:hydrogenase nickel incorporation protein HypA/HybF
MSRALEIAIDSAKGAGAQRIESIKLRIGALSGVVPEALSFAFDALKAGTMADTAALEVESVTVICHCATCAADFEPSSGPFFECPRCHEPSAHVIQGREMELVAVEVLQDD